MSEVIPLSYSTSCFLSFSETGFAGVKKVFWLPVIGMCPLFPPVVKLDDLPEAILNCP